MKVLITYASRHGSTGGIAKRIAAGLETRGLDVEVVPICDTNDDLGYDAVIAGSAVHDQRWLPEGSRFLCDHAAQLDLRPLWLFSVGMPGAVAPWLRRLAMREEPELAKQLRDVVNFRGHRLFSGVVRREMFSDRRSRFIFHLMGCRFGDFRDWPEIDRWATTIALELRPDCDLGPVTATQ